MPIRVKVTLADSTIIEVVLVDAYLAALARQQYAETQRANAEKVIADKGKLAISKVEVL
jgi:hypothetical protein